MCADSCAKWRDEKLGSPRCETVLCLVPFLPFSFHPFQISSFFRPPGFVRQAGTRRFAIAGSRVHPFCLVFWVCFRLHRARIYDLSAWLPEHQKAPRLPSRFPCFLGVVALSNTAGARSLQRNCVPTPLSHFSILHLFLSLRLFLVSLELVFALALSLLLLVSPRTTPLRPYSFPLVTSSSRIQCLLAQPPARSRRPRRPSSR